MECEQLQPARHDVQEQVRGRLPPRLPRGPAGDDPRRHGRDPGALCAREDQPGDRLSVAV